MSTHSSTPGLAAGHAEPVVAHLSGRLVGLIDLQLTLKHVHWNVLGPNFVAVHGMLDPQTDQVRSFTDEIAERIATLGGVPNGLSGNLVEERSWADYPLGRASTEAHLAELDDVYNGVIADHRAAMRAVEDLDAVSHDLLVRQAGGLELFQWFVRSHLGGANPVR